VENLIYTQKKVTGIILWTEALIPVFCHAAIKNRYHLENPTATPALLLSPCKSKEEISSLYEM